MHMLTHYDNTTLVSSKTYSTVSVAFIHFHEPLLKTVLSSGNLAIIFSLKWNSITTHCKLSFPAVKMLVLSAYLELRHFISN